MRDKQRACPIKLVEEIKNQAFLIRPPNAYTPIIVGLATELRIQIESLQSELDKHRWIPVEERLPDTNNQYKMTTTIELVWNKALVTGIYSEWFGWEVDGATVPREEYQSDITHWRAIDLPKERK